MYGNFVGPWALRARSGNITVAGTAIDQTKVGRVYTASRG